MSEYDAGTVDLSELPGKLRLIAASGCQVSRLTLPSQSILQLAQLIEADARADRLVAQAERLVAQTKADARRLGAAHRPLFVLTGLCGFGCGIFWAGVAEWLLG